jgi:acyl-coenzyme A synthetase/AMP-(fatty) acid ligase
MRLLKQDAFDSLRYSFFCGEPLTVLIAQAWQKAASSSEIINLYGPTEATIAISLYRPGNDIATAKSRNGILSIGKIFGGNHAKILGEDREPVRLGESGELCLAGTQVVDGYLAEKVLSDNVFFDDPLNGLRWYRTGDMVIEDKEGDIFFMGRKDSEIKISGYRVNLLEVEHVASEYPGLQQAVAHYESAEPGIGSLICFILPQAGLEIKSNLFLEYCRSRLPWYMVPEKIIFVNEIPLNTNGKTDRKALVGKYNP